MSDGHWVAFDVNTQTPHAHHNKSSQQNNDTYYSKKTSNKFEWSGDNDDILEDLYNEGKSIDYLASYFKVSKKYIENRLDKLGLLKTINNTSQTTGELWTDDEEEFLVISKANGVSNYEIAKELSRTEKAVERKYSKIPSYRRDQILSSNNQSNNHTKLNVYDKSMIAKYVYKALENQRAIKINYETENDRIKSERTIYPLKVHKYGDKKYIEAFCKLRDENRMFRISNITKLDYLQTEFAGNIYKSTMTYKPYENTKQTYDSSYNSYKTTSNTQTYNQSNRVSSEPSFIEKYWILLLFLFIGFCAWVSD